jgi:hypothetical protein
MAKAKNAETISAHVPKWLAPLIDERARRLGWSRSKYLGEILQKWYRDGASPVTDLDAIAAERVLMVADPPKPRTPTKILALADKLAAQQVAEAALPKPGAAIGSQGTARPKK